MSLTHFSPFPPLAHPQTPHRPQRITDVAVSVRERALQQLELCASPLESPRRRRREADDTGAGDETPRRRAARRILGSGFEEVALEQISRALHQVGKDRRERLPLPH